MKIYFIPNSLTINYDYLLKPILKPRVCLVSPYHNRIEQLLDKLWRHIQDRSVHPSKFRQLQVARH